MVVNKHKQLLLMVVLAETFVTNPNTLKVSDSGRGSGEPILEVE